MQLLISRYVMSLCIEVKLRSQGLSSSSNLLCYLKSRIIMRTVIKMKKTLMTKTLTKCQAN